METHLYELSGQFPISRDPPEGGTYRAIKAYVRDMAWKFPISRDPPEGGTPARQLASAKSNCVSNF